jgi:intracellular sulfur oxidation DsrE/DsrF family protein
LHHQSYTTASVNAKLFVFFHVDLAPPHHESLNPMKPKTSPLRLALVVAMLVINSIPLPAYADNSPVAAENTKAPLQIESRTGIKVVLQVNSADTIPNGIGKQVLAAKNLYDQYAALGMASGKDYEIAMVFRGDGVQFLLTDDAYDAKVKQPHPKGNPNKAILDALSKGGIKMYECGVAMKLKAYTPEDILPYSRIVVSGIGALVDFEKSGYLAITP